MWVHVVIFVMILCALTGWKKGWIPSSGIGGKDGIRLFAVVAIAGNLLGMILTLQNGGQVYPQGYRLEKENTGSYEKEFMVSVDGEEPVSMYIQVPFFLLLFQFLFRYRRRNWKSRRKNRNRIRS